MNHTKLTIVTKDRRSEQHLQASKYYSVELSPNDLSLSYRFKIWNMASKAMCVVVREDSEILTKLNVGDVLNMTYYTGHSAHPTAPLQTEIRHISRDEGGKFSGHYLVGISILNDQGFQGSRFIRPS